MFVGYGDTSHGSTGANDGLDAIPTKRAGLNRIDSVRDDFPGVEFLASDFDSGLQANNSLALIGFQSDVGFGADEVRSALGDSGGAGLYQRHNRGSDRFWRPSSRGRRERTK